MERGGLKLGILALGLALAIPLAAPAAFADVTGGPVRGAATWDYRADAGAVLAQAQGYDPRFALDFAFARATLYELEVPATPADQTRAGDLLPRVPTILSVRHVPRGTLAVDPAHGVTVLLLSDPRGFSASLPVEAPRDPARLAVEAVAPAGGVVDGDRLKLDPYDFDVASGLRYTVDGLAVEHPFEARAEGDLVALVGRAPVTVASGQNLYARDLAAGAPRGGERVLLVQAEDAAVRLTATGLTAVLRFPDASLEAGGHLLADLEGRQVGAAPGAGVRSDPGGLGLEAAAGVAGGLLGPRSADPVTGAPVEDQGLAFTALDAGTAAAGAALGTAVALAALGLAGLWASGKYGFFALLAPLYARLQTDEVLANGTRERIYRHVVEHPGVNVSEVVKQFGLGWGATVYHLRVLERNHLVSASKQGRQVCYFQNGGRFHGQMAGISALRNDNAALVARTILERPGMQQREVCRATRLAQPTVSWHLQRLAEAGLVADDGAARKRYHALPALEDLARRGFVAGVAAPAPAAPEPPRPASLAA